MLDLNTGGCQNNRPLKWPSLLICACNKQNSLVNVQSLQQRSENSRQHPLAWEWLSDVSFYVIHFMWLPADKLSLTHSFANSNNTNSIEIAWLCTTQRGKFCIVWVEDHLFATKDINCSGKRLIKMVRTVDPKSLKNNILKEVYIEHRSTIHLLNKGQNEKKCFSLFHQHSQSAFVWLVEDVSQI